MRLWAIVGVLIVGLLTTSADFRTRGLAASAPPVVLALGEAAAPPTDTVEEAPAEDVEATPPDMPAPDPFDGASADARVAWLTTGGVPAPSTAAATPVLPVAEPPPAQWVSGPPPLPSNNILGMAQTLLDIPYLWGGNTEKGMDCSAYISRAWGISRQTTDTLYRFASPITKDELRPGDIMNLTTSQDPRRYGHVRLFAAWANTEQTRMWVYEETPRQSVFHVIAYDARYTPMRRANIVLDGSDAPLIPAPTPPPARTPAPRSTPTPRVASASATPTLTRTPTPSPAPTPTPSPTPTPTP